MYIDVQGVQSLCTARLSSPSSSCSCFIQTESKTKMTILTWLSRFVSGVKSENKKMIHFSFINKHIHYLCCLLNYQADLICLIGLTKTWTWFFFVLERR